jgi:hypothetical protein
MRYGARGCFFNVFDLVNQQFEAEGRAARQGRLADRPAASTSRSSVRAASHRPPGSVW